MRSLLRACDGDREAAGRLLGVRPRTIGRWLAGEIGMADSVYQTMRLLSWLDREGVQLGRLADRDRAALDALRERAEDDDELDEAALADLES